MSYHALIVGYLHRKSCDTVLRKAWFSLHNTTRVKHASLVNIFQTLQTFHVSSISVILPFRRYWLFFLQLYYMFDLQHLGLVCLVRHVVMHVFLHVHF